MIIIVFTCRCAVIRLARQVITTSLLIIIITMIIIVFTCRCAVIRLARQVRKAGRRASGGKIFLRFDFCGKKVKSDF